MEIQIGEYVRTKKGKIAKVKTIYSEEDRIKMKNFSVKKETLINGNIKIPDVVKHSFKLVDLIEVGDIVEIFDVLHNDIFFIWSEDMVKALKEDIENGIEIKSIVTKEMFESIKYEV